MSNLSLSKRAHTGLLVLLLGGCVNFAAAQDVDPKTAAETAKAIAEANKAKAEAEAAAAKTKYGALADHETTGSVEVGTNAGKLEAMLLASEATRKSAVLIAKRVGTKLAADKSSPAIFVIGESEKLNYEAYDSFRVQVLLIERQLKEALKAQPGGAPGEISIATSGVGVATALSVIGNLFRSDYKVSGVELTADDMVLAKSVMLAALDDKLANPLLVPGLYAMPLTPEDNPAIAQLKTLDDLRAKANALHLQLKQKVDDLNARAKQNAKEKPTLLKEAATHAPAITALEVAMKRYDDFLAKLATADDKGSVPLTTVARQAYIADRLSKGSYLLVLKANYLGGSAYAQKNFWTFFGSMPFSVAGGALSSFTLLDGRTGAVLDTGVFAQTAPFAKVHRTVDRYVDGKP